jgi:hypothetical protein
MELINSIEWEDYKELLTSGNPPIYMLLLGFNGLIFLIWIARKLMGKKPMTKSRALLVKLGILGSNGLILVSDQIDIADMMDSFSF